MKPRGMRSSMRAPKRSIVGRHFKKRFSNGVVWFRLTVFSSGRNGRENVSHFGLCSKVANRFVLPDCGNGGSSRHRQDNPAPLSASCRPAADFHPEFHFLLGQRMSNRLCHAVGMKMKKSVRLMHWPSPSKFLRAVAGCFVHHLKPAEQIVRL